MQSGLHLNTRQMANPKPQMAPHCDTACMAYSEHVGVKRQEGGNEGEMKRLYPPSSLMISLCIHVILITSCLAEQLCHNALHLYEWCFDERRFCNEYQAQPVSYLRQLQPVAFSKQPFGT